MNNHTTDIPKFVSEAINKTLAGNLEISSVISCEKTQDFLSKRFGIFVDANRLMVNGTILEFRWNVEKWAIATYFPKG